MVEAGFWEERVGKGFMNINERYDDVMV